MALLSDALSLLSGGTSWTTGANARLANGLPCSPNHPDAVSWDVVGALLKANYGVTNYTELHAAYESIRNLIPNTFKSRDVEAFNDTAVQSDIAALFA